MCEKIRILPFRVQYRLVFMPQLLAGL